MTIGLAWLAGVASFLSPCVLALVPAYKAYRGGRSSRSPDQARRGRWELFAHGLAFVAGFGLAAAGSEVGHWLFNYHEWIARLGGLVVIFFGPCTLGWISLPFLGMDTRRLSLPDAGLGYRSSSLIGVFFSAGWSPCIGPVLGAILTLALDSTSLPREVLLLSAYSLGLGVPFLLAGLAMGRLAEGLRRNAWALRAVSWIGGGWLVLLGGCFSEGLSAPGSLGIVRQHGGVRPPCVNPREPCHNATLEPVTRSAEGPPCEDPRRPTRVPRRVGPKEVSRVRIGSASSLLVGIRFPEVPSL